MDRWVQHICGLAVLGLSLMIITGCAGIGKRLEAPKIQMAGMQPVEVRGFETEFRVDLRVMNGNDADLEVRGIECELQLNGKKFAAGVSRIDTVIPAFESEVVSLTLYSSIIDMVKGVMALPGRKSIEYRVEGKITLGGALPSSVPFELTGSISPEELQPNN